MTTILADVKLDYDDVLLMPKRSEVSSRKHVVLARNFKLKHSSSDVFMVPIIASNMATVGTVSMANALVSYGIGTALHKFVPLEAQMEVPWAFVSTGIDEEFLNRKATPKFICIDVANGYNKKFAEFVSKVRDKFQDSCIMAGNVVTGDMVYDLLERGADIVKVGIGSGAVCTTRRVTGVGYPQLSAIMECADAAHGVKGHICGDGGLTCPGDFAKGFAAGADFLMVGSMLAGTDESECEVEVDDNGHSVVTHYGMASSTARELHFNNENSQTTAEGKVVQLPYKGSVKPIVEEILGGLRSACTYVGAATLKDLPKCATFLRVNRQLNTSLNKYE